MFPIGMGAGMGGAGLGGAGGMLDILSLLGGGGGGGGAGAAVSPSRMGGQTGGLSSLSSVPYSGGGGGDLDALRLAVQAGSSGFSPLSLTKNAWSDAASLFNTFDYLFGHGRGLRRNASKMSSINRRIAKEKLERMKMANNLFESIFPNV